MKKRKRFILQLIIFALYAVGVFMIGHGLLQMWEPMAYVFYGVITVYIGYSVFLLLEDSK